MIEFVAFIVFLFLIGSFLCFAIGLISPSVFRGLFKKNLRRKKISLIFGGITIGLFVVFCVLAVNSPTTTQLKKAVVVTKVIKPTISSEDILLSHEKKLKEIDDQMLKYDFQLSTKCALIVNAVANNNPSSIGDWSTASDDTYETLFGERGAELNMINADRKSSTSADFSTWQKLADIDGAIDSDLGNVENECDNLTTDPLAVSNISTYEDAVKSDQAEVANFMTQRKSILTSLGY